MLKLPFALIVCLFTLASCSAEDASPPDEDVGAVEQDLACPKDVVCPGTPAYSYPAGTNIACVYYPGGIVYVAKPAACQQCCAKYGTCVPGGCGGIVYTNIWTCRTGSSCNP